MKHALDIIYPNKSDQPSFLSMITGSTSKILASTVTYPYQVIKSRLQQRESSKQIHTQLQTNVIRLYEENMEVHLYI